MRSLRPMLLVLGSGLVCMTQAIQAEIPGLCKVGQVSTVAQSCLTRQAFELDPKNQEASVTANGCVPGANTLCLHDGRFAVVVQYMTADNPEVRLASARALSQETGTFTFFSEGNVEILIKVLDACTPPFNSFWVFLAPMTDVYFVVQVLDTWASHSLVYVNQLGHAAPVVQDTDGFKTCGAVSPDSNSSFAHLLP